MDEVQVRVEEMPKFRDLRGFGVFETALFGDVVEVWSEFG